MRLQSVRGLKQELVSGFKSQLLAEAQEIVSLAALPSLGEAGMAASIGERTGNMAFGVIPADKADDYRLAIRVQKRSNRLAQIIETATARAKNEVDVRYIGSVKPLQVGGWYRTTMRPLRIGSSVGHVNITAGTLGCFVRKGTGGKHMMLSNNHVLADENTASIGDAIVQPGPTDLGVSLTHTVGQLTNFVALSNTQPNEVDCAVAQINDGVQIEENNMWTLPDLVGTGDAANAPHMQVMKIGRTTGMTHGQITAIELDNVLIGYDMGTVSFDNQIEIEGHGQSPFSRGGDSGSLVVDIMGNAVGLLFAGSQKGGTNDRGLTYANQIDTVLDELKVELIV